MDFEKIKKNERFSKQMILVDPNQPYIFRYDKWDNCDLIIPIEIHDSTTHILGAVFHYEDDNTYLYNGGSYINLLGVNLKSMKLFTPQKEIEYNASVDDYHDFRDKVIMVLNQFESIKAVDRL